MASPVVKTVLPKLCGSRQRARTIMSAALDEVSHTATEPVIVLDCSAVVAMTIGFADEIVTASLDEHPLLELVIAELNDPESMSYLIERVAVRGHGGRMAIA